MSQRARNFVYFIKFAVLTHVVMVGADALDAIRDNQPDIVILDIMLPDTNGLEVLKQIRALLRRQDRAVSDTVIIRAMEWAVSRPD